METSLLSCKAVGSSRRLSMVAMAGLALMINAGLALAAQDYGLERDGVRYGAFPDGVGRIGGGKGYAGAILSGDLTVSDAASLVDALSKALPGQVVFIPDGADIRFPADAALPIAIPAGVTLSGSRGQGASKGAELRCDAQAADPFILLCGTGSRITGLRIRGPEPRQRREIWNKAYLDILKREGKEAADAYFYSFPISMGIKAESGSAEIDNCEISAWSRAGIFLQGGAEARIHHCSIHENQRHGLGYGISLDDAHAEIWCNIFEDNRHSIAGTGNPAGGYLAHDNVEFGCTLENLHRFDMHGTKETKGGFPVAGGRVEISNNTFVSKWLAVKIRGKPVDEVVVRNNIFWVKSIDDAVYTWPGTDNHRIFDNLYAGARLLRRVWAKWGK